MRHLRNNKHGIQFARMDIFKKDNLLLLVIFVCGFIVGVFLALLQLTYSQRHNQERISTMLRQHNFTTDNYLYDTKSIRYGYNTWKNEFHVNFSEKAKEFLNSWYKEDDNRTADTMAHGIRVLCWVMTGPENLDKRAIHVKHTWGKRCNVLLFASDYENKTFPTINITVPGGHENLMYKTAAAFDYAYKHHYNDADWFLKADDDTYVIVENLRYLVSKYDPRNPVYFGHHFRIDYAKMDYFSGGGGYVVSKEALRRFANRHTYEPKVDRYNKHCNDDRGAEDAEFGKCMTVLGVTMGDSRDKLGRTRFHSFVPDAFLLENYPPWYYDYDGNGASAGIDSVSDYAVTFHYLNPETDMYKLDFLIYSLKVYGIASGLQEINGPARKNYTDVPIKDRVNVKNQIENITQTCSKTTHGNLDVYAC